MELLATVDWLMVEEGCAPTLSALREGLHRWPAGTLGVIARRGCLMIAVADRLDPFAAGIGVTKWV